MSAPAKVEWSGQQSEALKRISAWVKDKKAPQVFKLFGFAGTGKTTLAREMESMVKKVLYATFTGKAALVMRSKGCENASTVHSLIYRVHENEDGTVEFKLNRDSDLADADVLVIDEGSMIGEKMGKDILRFKVKVLVLGDPFQLPPVKDAGFFTLGEPDYMLTEIHRQARDNPIIRMSMDIREGRGLDYGAYGESRVINRASLGQKAVMSAGQLLCGVNATRRGLNSKIRTIRNHVEEIPEPGEKLICLKNDSELEIYNGGLWTSVKSELMDGERIVKMVLLPEGAPETAHKTEVKVPIEFFRGGEGTLDLKYRRYYQEFDYGYAMTVHKSQGSQWDNVVLFNESHVFRDTADRWLYTGVTRAAKSITVVQ